MKHKSFQHVVLIGGGTGNSVFLRSLKKYTENITAIVTVADDGGSSGRIRSELGMLPPGDIRNCIIALADEENIMAELMNVRFTEGFMKKQSFGNIVIAAMNKISGNFPLAVKRVSDVLAITGRVLPVTTENIILSAKISNGKTIKGESHIPKYCARTKQHIESMNIIPNQAGALSDCIDAIYKADIIVFSPGSLYTSLIPNLLVNGICEALEQCKAKKYFLINIMTQNGETQGYTLSDHIHALEKHSGGRKIFDTVVYNTKDIPVEVKNSYRKENAAPVENVIEESYFDKYRFIGLELASISNNIVRHNSELFWEYIFHGKAENIENGKIIESAVG